MIGENLAAVRARIDAAARRANRDPASIALVAVSKTKPAADIAEAYAAGQRVFGENYAQELVDKCEQLKHLDIEWHFIGRLQTNKAKYVARVARMVHAVDSDRLAHELGKRAKSLDVLIEVNVGGEDTKGGVTERDLPSLIATIKNIPTLRLRGLMSIPPPSDDPRKFHRRLRELRDAHGGAIALPVLSMGMTDDLEVAVEEGATLVRVGTAIFGARAPSR
jgi:PLP dependent protein